MADGVRIEPFDPRRHDRSRFACGVEALDDYLRTRLGQHGRKDLSRGWVAVEMANAVVGYYTLASGRISVSVLPERRGLPARMPLPTTLLGRLAVDRGWQGKGLGAALLAHALRIAVRHADSIASAVIEVDAKDERARSFYAKFGFKSLVDDRLHLYLPMDTARSLAARM